MAHKNRLKNQPVHGGMDVRQTGAGTARARTASPEVDRDEIARRAYTYWEQRGCPDGCPEEDWYRAENDLRRQS